MDNGRDVPLGGNQPAGDHTAGQPTGAQQSGAQQTNARPGWYPVPGGQQFWDGAAWVGAVHLQPPAQFRPTKELINGTTSEERSMGLLAHLLIFGAAGIGPLVLYLIKKNESPFVRGHAAAAINLFITMLLILVPLTVGNIVTILSSSGEVFGVGQGTFFPISYFLLLMTFIVSYVLSVIAAIAANKGEPYRYPLTLQLVR